MYEKFNDRARRAVVLAVEEARELDHPCIDIQHILLGVLDEGGMAAKALGRLRVTPDSARQWLSQGGSHPDGHIPFAPEAKEVFEQASREAQALGFSYIGPEHLLLGVVAQANEVVEQMLGRQGGGLASVREQVILDMNPDPIVDRLDGIHNALAEIAETLVQLLRRLDGDRNR